LTLCVRYQMSAPVYADWTENLSAGGFFVRTDRRFEPGHRLQATLSFPGLLEPLAVDGKVAWVRTASPVTAGGVGLELTDGPGRERLSQVVAAPAPDAAAAGHGPFRLLVVDDNERLVRSYQRAMERLPCLRHAEVETTFARDGREALELVATRGTDLLITDIYMPDIDGYQLIERLRSDPATAALPIIIITGGRSDERKRAEALGVDAFLLKPVLFAPLMETIVSLVAFRRHYETGV